MNNINKRDVITYLKSKGRDEELLHISLPMFNDKSALIAVKEINDKYAWATIR